MSDSKTSTGTPTSTVGALSRKNVFEQMQTKLAARFVELDELYTKIQIVSGYTVEQLIDLFASGCIISRPTEKPGIPIKVLRVKGYTPEELVHLIRSVCCSIFADDDEMKVFGELEVYVSWQGTHQKESRP